MIAVQRSGRAALKAVFSHLDQVFQVEPPQALGALPVLAGTGAGIPLGRGRPGAAMCTVTY